MKKLVSFVFLFVSICSVFGQELHTPAEIFKIMEESPISYQIGLLESVIPVPDRSSNVNVNEFYRVVDGNSISTFRYEIDSLAAPFAAKAEEYFIANQYSKAREMYLEVIKLDPNHYKAMTYIGQTYGIENDFDKAIEWYKKSISHNYIDYMAHWFIADAYREQGSMDQAVDEITIAMILNRNNPRIKQSFDQIYALKKLNTENWSFNPQIKIDSIARNKISLMAHEKWLGYGMVKALWRYEPGYRESMGSPKGTFSTLEEKEAIIPLFNSMDKASLKQHPELRALQLAFDKEFLDEYIIYEIMLPAYPFAAFQLPQETILSVAEYVKTVRGKGK